MTANNFTLEQQIDHLINAQKNQRSINERVEEKIKELEEQNKLLMEITAMQATILETLTATDSSIIDKLEPLVHEYKSRTH